MASQKYVLIVFPAERGHAIPCLEVASALVAEKIPVKVATVALDDEQIADFVKTNYPELDLFQIPSATEDPTLLNKAERIKEIFQTGNPVLMLRFLSRWHAHVNEALVNYARENQLEKPAAIIHDSVMICGTDLANEWNIPSFLISCTLTDLFVIKSMQGADIPPLNSPRPILDAERKSIAGKVFIAMIRSGTHVLKKLYFYPAIETMRKKYGLSSYVNYENFIESKDVQILANTGFPLDIPRPVHEKIEFVGPLISEKSKALSKPLQDWLVESDKPVVLVSMGSLAILSEEVFSELISGLTDDSFRVIWCHRAGKDRLPASFFSADFLPQKTLLKSDKIKLFVSHCGSGSVHESLYFGKPILGIPQAGDQPAIAARVVDSGCGLFCLPKDIKADLVRQKVIELLTNLNYTEQARDVGRQLKAYGGLKKVIDMVSLAIKQ